VAFAYLNASAIVKLGVREPESSALHDYLNQFDRLVSCMLARRSPSSDPEVDP
jgi:hypothetical protein